MDWKILLVCFIGSIAASVNNGGWQENKEYNYEIISQTLSGHPDVGNQYSGIVVKCGLKIIVRSNGILAAKLHDTKYAKIHTHLPDGPCTNIPHEKLHFNDLYILSSHIEIEMKNGVFKRIRMRKQVPNWEINMIKSIVSQLQLDTRGENLISDPNNEVPSVDKYSGSYRTMEESILGKYEVLYEINQLPEVKYQDDQLLVPLPDLKGEGKIMEIVKTKNFDNSENHVGYNHGTSDFNNWRPFSNNMGEFFSKSSVNKVTISGKLDKYTIQSVKTTNQLYVSPAHNSDQKMMVSSQYNLKLTSVILNTRPPPPLENPSKYVDLKSLVYTYNNPLSEIEEENQQDAETSGTSEFRDRDWKREDLPPLPAPLHPLNVGYMGKSVQSAKGADIPSAVVREASHIAQDLQQPGKMPQGQTLSKFIKMNQLIRLLNKSELQKVSDKLHCNESDSEKCNAWKVYCDGLAESGTEAALKEIQRLTTEKKLDHLTAAYMILQIVKSARVPNYRYMRMFYSFSTHSEVQSSPVLNSAAILGFSRLVGNVFVDRNFSQHQYPVYVYGSFYTPEGKKFVRDEFIPYLSKELDSAIEKNDNQKAQIYIYALGNVGHPKMLNTYKKYLEGKKEVSHFLRSQMVASLWRMAYLFPEMGQQALNNLYRNPAEHTDVRIQALQLLPLTEPSASMFQKIAVNIYFDANQQVNAAADSMIRTIAKLQVQGDSNLQTNAQSAVHLLPKRKYGLQYSKTAFVDSLPEPKTIFNEFLSTIGAEDSLTEKSLQYTLYATGGNLGQTMFSLQFVTNSMEALMKVLRNETGDSNEDQHGAHHGGDSKWSSEEVRRNLKIKPNQLESPEANVYFGMSGLERSFAFDINNLRNLKKAIQDIKESLKEGKDICITKFIDQQTIAMGFPTETGLPVWYSSDNPLLINIEGRVSGDFQTGEKSNHLESVDIDSRIKVVIAKKMQDRVGFIAPFDHHHYIAGHDVNAQVYLPLKMKVKANLNENVHNVQLEPSTNEKLIHVVHFSTVPYTSRHNILKLQPVLEDPNTHIINAEPKGQFNAVVGQNAMGMEWRVNIACEHRILRDGKLFNAIGDHRITSSLFMHLFHGYIHNSKLEISYDAEKSNHRMNILASHEKRKKSSTGNNNSDNDNENESNDARKLFNTQNPKEDVLRQASEGVSNPTVDLYQLRITYNDKHPIDYYTIAGVAQSDTRERTKIVVLSTKHDNQRQHANYRSVLLAKSQTPNVNAIDPLFALKHAPYSNSHVKLVFGKDYDSATKINASIEMSRSHNRSPYLQGSQMAHDCKQELSEGNLLLRACSKLHINANSLDQIRVQIHHKNLKPEHQNITNHLFNYVKHSLYGNMEENSVNASGSGEHNKVNLRINFHDDFSRVNCTTMTEHQDVQFNDVHIPSLLRPIVKVHPAYNALDRVKSEMYESQWYQDSCVVDNSAVTTFDNKTYKVKQGDWTVMFLYVPNNVNKTINTHKNTHDEEHDANAACRQEEEFLVLTRKLNNEIKITIRTHETQHKLIEIDMSQKGKSNVEVRVNQQKQQLHTDSVTEVADGYIKMLLLPNHEVRVEVEHAFTIFYDGARARLTTQYNDKFRNKVRGLCGNFDSQQSNDFYAPETCVYNNVEQFVASYQPYQKEPRVSQHKKNKCSYQEIIYGNLISEHDSKEEKCTEYRTVYTMVDNSICITVNPVRVCKSGCKAHHKTHQNVLVNCIENDENARRIIGKIDNNEDPSELLVGKNLKEVSIELPEYCSRRL